jgi:hypothetical protein
MDQVVQKCFSGGYSGNKCSRFHEGAFYSSGVFASCSGKMSLASSATTDFFSQFPDNSRGVIFSGIYKRA